MKVGDLIRNKATGELAIVTGVGEKELKLWITLAPLYMKSAYLYEHTVYFASYFEVISEHQGDDNDQ